MNISQIEQNLQTLVSSFSEESFIYDLLLAYGLPRATISLLKTGKHNLSKVEGQIILKKKLFFVVIKDGQDLHSTIDALNKDESTHRHDPRFLIVTDHTTLLAIDVKTKESLDIPINEIDKHFDFFLPWAWMEKSKYKSENPADIKAAYTLAKLYDAIREDEDNNITTSEEIHTLNVFLSRILFCFFAEDTGIFPKDIFTYSIESHTQADGSDLNSYLEWLFEILDQSEDKRWNISEYLKKFPYVNGGLFKDRFPVPVFKRKSRNILIECGRDLNWSEINPDIFGSMVQAVVHPDKRGGLGMHYTSVPNIMKVIQPLFLDELKAEYEQNIDNPKNLEKLLVRMSKIRIFDPACGSGNFLIISYKELRKLEMEILNTLYQAEIMTFPISHISLSQFYGIEIDDFAHGVAGLSLYIANHQMNLEFTGIFWVSEKLLPLQASGNIVCANATRVDWEEVCPKEAECKTYILGNPPYLGFNMQSEEQKEDMKTIYPFPDNMKFLDYIVCWFFKATYYIDQNSQAAFVTTNSVCQGTQVPMIWPEIFSKNIEINFTYPEFAWSNNAKKNAGVICSIIGLRKITTKPKFIYSSWAKQQVANINAYLVDWGNIIVEKRQRPLSKLSPISTWNIPYDGWNLILNEDEKSALLSEYPQSARFIKKLSGSFEFINNVSRYCLWISNQNVDIAKSIPPINNRINNVAKSRNEWGKIAKNYMNVPHRFYMINEAKKTQIIIPRVSSIKREYIPTGFLESDTIISDSAQVIYDPETFVFGVINSRMHMVWVRALAWRLKSDYRYSAVICYNTFPFPNITSSQKDAITHNVYNILSERERYPEKTMAELYDAGKMPDGLKEAHRLLDQLIERCYRATPFRSDEERLSYLFTLYEKMIAEEQTKS